MTRENPMSLPGGGDLVLVSPDGKGTVLYPYFEPTTEQIAVFLADGSTQSNFGKLGAVLIFLGDILENPNHVYMIRDRLRDRNDALTIETLFEGLSPVLEAQADFPTEQQSVSPSRPSTTGRRSTGKVQPGV